MTIKATSDNIVLMIEGNQNLEDKSDGSLITCKVIDVGPGREDIFIHPSGQKERHLRVPEVAIGERVVIARYHAMQSLAVPCADQRRVTVVNSYSILAKIEE